MPAPLSSFIQAAHPATIPLALTDLDKLGLAIIGNAASTISSVGTVFVVPTWDVVGLPSIQGTPAGDPKTYEYDLCFAACAAFDINQPPVIAGLKLPTPVIPPASCLPKDALSAAVAGFYNTSASATKAGAYVDPAFSGNLQKIFDAIAAFIIQSYI